MTLGRGGEGGSIMKSLWYVLLTKHCYFCGSTAKIGHMAPRFEVSRPHSIRCTHLEDFCERKLCSSQRPLLGAKSFHALIGISTRDPSSWATTDPVFRQHGHRYRIPNFIREINKGDWGRGLWHVWGENLKQTYHVEDLSVDGRIILKWFFSKLGGMTDTGCLP